jgi:hypothetical protein
VTDTPGTLAADLGKNRARRDELTTQLNAAKQELRSLLQRGQELSMEVSEMARHAGVTRDTAHRILREAGTMSWKEKREWAHAVLETIESNRQDIDQQIFRSLVQTSLYSALGSQRDEVPPSLDAIFDSAIETISANRGKPFKPHINRSQLAQLPGWPVEPFEIIQRGTGRLARFQLRQHGAGLAPERATLEDVARDLKEQGGAKPTYIDRTGPECVAVDGRRLSWDLLKDV